MNKLFILLVFLIISSCNQNKREEDKQEQKVNYLESKEENNIDFSDGRFRIVFEGTYAQDDLFLVFYSNKEGEKISNKNVIKQKINGNKNPQKIILTFPENTFPFSMRLDFSDSKNQKNVKFQKILFIDKYNKVIIDSSNIEDFFVFNNYMQFDKNLETLYGNIFKLNSIDAYNPYFISNNKFSEVLKKFKLASKNERHVQLIDDYANTDFTDGRYRIVLDAMFKIDDLILIYFEEDTSTSFDISNSVKKIISGSNNFQKICFTLPKGRYPSKISLDISNNPKQEKILIKSIEFFENNSHLIIHKKDFAQHFHPNNYISYDSISKKYNYKVIIENGTDKYNPYFVSSSKLNEKLINF